MTRPLLTLNPLPLCQGCKAEAILHLYPLAENCARDEPVRDSEVA